MIDCQDPPDESVRGPVGISGVLGGDFGHDTLEGLSRVPSSETGETWQKDMPIYWIVQPGYVRTTRLFEVGAELIPSLKSDLGQDDYVRR